MNKSSASPGAPIDHKSGAALVPTLIKQAEQLLQRGMLIEARNAGRDALELDANNPFLCHLLAEIELQARELNQATQYVDRAIVLFPGVAQFHFTKALILQTLGQVDAIGCLRAALILDPTHSGALSLLGQTFLMQRLYQEAIPYLRRDSELKPRDAKAMWLLGQALDGAGLSKEAISCYTKATTLQPTSGPAILSLANILKRSGDVSGSNTFYERLFAVPGMEPEGLCGSAICLTSMFRLDEASNRLERALRIAPHYFQALYQLGNVKYLQSNFNEAIKYYQRALEISPYHAAIRVNLAITLLKAGLFQEGWTEYEWRWRLPDSSSEEARKLSAPRWEGQREPGLRVLLCHEQGLGDTIQFARYVALVEERGLSVTLICKLPLKTLFKESFPNIEVISAGDAIPDVDFQCPLLSLPLMFDTQLETIPPNVPYLRTSDKRVKEWRDRIQGQEGFKVGLVWAGAGMDNARSAEIDFRRSVNFSLFECLLDTPGCVFYSLQKGNAAVQAKEASESGKLTDWTEQLTDFADTTALIANLDLIISVDTSVAHLAGAMGKPVWLLSRFDGCWRWLVDREDSPWYPTMKIFRQASPGDWGGVIGQVAEALQSECHTARPRIDANK